MSEYQADYMIGALFLIVSAVYRDKYIMNFVWACVGFLWLLKGVIDLMLGA